MFSELLALSSDPLARAFLIIIATFFLEDLAILGTGILIAEGTLSASLGFWALVTGLVGGDFGLYLLGRSRFSKWAVAYLLKPERLSKLSETLKTNIIGVLLVARCIPGLRLPTFFAAGVVSVKLKLFLFVITFSGLAWVGLLLPLAVYGHEFASEHLGQFRFLVVLVLVVIWGVVTVVVRRKSTPSVCSSP